MFNIAPDADSLLMQWTSNAFRRSSFQEPISFCDIRRNLDNILIRSILVSMSMNIIRKELASLFRSVRSPKFGTDLPGLAEKEGTHKWFSLKFEKVSDSV